MKLPAFSIYIFAIFLTSFAPVVAASEHPTSGGLNAAASDGASPANIATALARTLPVIAKTAGELQQHTIQANVGRLRRGQEIVTTAVEPAMFTSEETFTTTTRILEPAEPKIDDDGLSEVGVAACLSAAIGSMLFVVILARHHLTAQDTTHAYLRPWELDQRYEMAVLAQSHDFVAYRDD